MDLPRTLTSATAASLLALAACTTTPQTRNPAQLQLSDSARALYENARVLAERADAEKTPGLSADAHELERRAYDFNAAVASGRASDNELRADFDQVRGSYQRVHDALEHSNTAQARSELDLVNRPYRDVASRMGESPPPASGS
ncbi:MAG TPA: hypothetical protein VKQ31_03670 [Steroidobacteraceae bacterium]|nr:hypothetical protein [Steroidobacteraceae bacterium]